MAENLKLDSTASAINVLGADRLALVNTLDWSIIGTLALLVVLGFGLRVTQLGAIGFAEDEMNKLDAIHAYERGDFSANSEHPMVMKLLMWVSVRKSPMDTPEAALRLPNALIGALTVIPLFLLTAAFFDRWTALLAAAFWAFGINAVTHNRIGKEDSLLVFFMLFAFFFFVRAKQISPSNRSARTGRYAASAVSFGLMIASKYFPHYLGLNMLFHHNFHVRSATPDEPSGRTPGWFFLVIMGVFLVMSPAVLLPQVWEYMNAYMGEQLLTHSGYLFAGELYKNNMSSTPFWGTPIYFYLLFLAIKVPLITIVAFLIGLAVAARHPRHVGHAFLLFMFLFWIVPYSLIGGKWLRYTLSLMPLVYLTAAVGILGLGLFFWGHWLARLAGWEEVLLVATGLVLLAVEVFVTPGFGLAGALGLMALIGGLGLSLVGSGATWVTILTAAGQVLGSLLLAITGALAMFRFLPRLPFGRPLILATELEAREGFASAPEADLMWLGKRGTVASTLRPAGIATLEGERVDVVSAGEFVEVGEPITVVKVDGNRIVVRQLRGKD